MVKAIDTHYKGYKFRSRLEARFAVFLDVLRITWDYEVEGFDLPQTGKYLPDFFLPNGGLPESYIRPMWIEVKAGKPTLQEINKLRELAYVTKTAGAFFCGNTLLTKGNHFKSIVEFFYGNDDDCGLSVLELFQIPLEPLVLAPNKLPKEWWAAQTNRIHFEDNYDVLLTATPMRKLRPAAKAALSARFEFGESG